MWRRLNGFGGGDVDGQIWLKVPRSIKVICRGRLAKNVSAKDLVLFITGKLTISGATYQSVEFEGDTFKSMTLASRMAVCNMVSEMGAKTGFVHPKGLNLPYAFTPTYPDKNAQYSEVFEFDVSNLKHVLAIPNSPDNIEEVRKHVGKRIDYAFIGTCTNGRLEDLQAAAKILRGGKIASHVRMVIAPASKKVLLDAISDGTAFDLISSGRLTTIDGARKTPIQLLESGPAGGSMASVFFGKLTGLSHLLAFDMGGTTAKASIIHDYKPEITNHFEAGRVHRFKKGSGLPVRIPVIDMIEIGAGGGSIARINHIGLLTVGPDSASSQPGPACYGRGGDMPTVTDADLVLGYLNADYFLGGTMKLVHEE